MSKPPLPPKDGQNYHADSPTDTTKVKWSTFPPSGGGHYARLGDLGLLHRPGQPAPASSTTRSTAASSSGGARRSRRRRSPSCARSTTRARTAMLGTPIAGLGNKVAITAWTGDPARYYKNGYYGIGHLAICPQLRREGVHRVPRRVPRPRPGGHPALVRPARHRPRRLASCPSYPDPRRGGETGETRLA